MGGLAVSLRFTILALSISLIGCGETKPATSGAPSVPSADTQPRLQTARTALRAIGERVEPVVKELEDSTRESTRRRSGKVSKFDAKLLELGEIQTAFHAELTSLALNERSALEPEIKATQRQIQIGNVRGHGLKMRWLLLDILVGLLNLVEEIDKDRDSHPTQPGDIPEYLEGLHKMVDEAEKTVSENSLTGKLYAPLAPTETWNENRFRRRALIEGGLSWLVSINENVGQVLRELAKLSYQIPAVAQKDPVVETVRKSAILLQKRILSLIENITIKKPLGEINRLEDIVGE